ncbi:alcohol dehydrogenase catalytic domain-containing protein [Streptomyces sp. A7024]|uniref:Alcohol dehydrogenase catalytic domain-containing protein n=1 Tax=Streptomyces coryli TaxID=1128680 RepID=A0A6G4TUJ1_9ACTN|nr:alcohol dehydrogenase catalytic domain-containing protein [Streptomyces coryli]NGN62697.1 alcohol dehydrogenase catalytic domain-containing protein [Streptomyces coryli]
MRAVTLVAPGLVLVDDHWPEPRTGPSEVLVEIRGVGLCGSDAAVVAGHRAVPRLPWVLGHEAYGMIRSVGAEVTDRHPGQLVAIEPNYPCLACPTCLTGATSGCVRRRIAGISEPGMLAERVSVPAGFTWPIPATWRGEDIVCIEPLSVAVNAVGLAGPGPGRRCLVLGAGSQGQLVCLAAQQAGAAVHVTDPHAGRLALARELGALPDDGACDYPVVIETSGAVSAFEQAVERAAPGGRVVVVGQSEAPARVSTFRIVQRRLTIRGCLIYDHPGGFARTLEAISAHDLRPGRVLRARYSAADAPRAFAESAGVAGKSWISFEEETA